MRRCARLGSVGEVASRGFGGLRPVAGDGPLSPDSGRVGDGEFIISGSRTSSLSALGSSGDRSGGSFPAISNGRSSTKALRDGGRLETRCAADGAAKGLLLVVGPVRLRTEGGPPTTAEPPPPRWDMTVVGQERVCDDDENATWAGPRRSRSMRREEDDGGGERGGLRAMIPRPGAPGDA